MHWINLVAIISYTTAHVSGAPTNQTGTLTLLGGAAATTLTSVGEPIFVYYSSTTAASSKSTTRTSSHGQATGTIMPSPSPDGTI